VHIHYESRVIEEFAARLYGRAALVVAVHALRGALLGLVVGGTGAWLLGHDSNLNATCGRR